jgi:hypothetical protein
MQRDSRSQPLVNLKKPDTQLNRFHSNQSDYFANNHYSGAGAGGGKTPKTTNSLTRPEAGCSTDP